MQLRKKQSFDQYQALTDISIILVSPLPHDYFIPKDSIFYLNENLLIHYYPNRKQTQIFNRSAISDDTFDFMETHPLNTVELIPNQIKF